MVDTIPDGYADGLLKVIGGWVLEIRLKSFGKNAPFAPNGREGAGVAQSVA